MLAKLSKLGPGLLFAGAAIGVSHLVQSTRAGADFGWGLICPSKMLLKELKSSNLPLRYFQLTKGEI